MTIIEKEKNWINVYISGSLNVRGMRNRTLFFYNENLTKSGLALGDGESIIYKKQCPKFNSDLVRRPV